jgi:hypothetical protein
MIEFSTTQVRPSIDSKGMARGVSVLTSGIKAIGYDVFIDDKSLQTCLQVAQGFSDGIQVKADHGSGVLAIVGKITNFRIEGAQLRGDLQFLVSHPSYPALREMVQQQAGTFGLSISFASVEEEIGGRKYVRISDLFSVDLVSRPAANPGGLFSANLGPSEPPKTFGQAVNQIALQRGVSKATAIALAVSAHTELYAEYRKRGGDMNAGKAETPDPTEFPRLFQAAFKTGRSRVEALTATIRDFPAAYSSWLAYGDTTTLDAKP